MWRTEYSEYKCPYCNYEYKYVVGRGVNYEYKEKVYHHEKCPNCKEEFLVRNRKSIKMPEDKSEVKFHSSWIS